MMKKEYQQDYEAMPPVLRALLDAELAAGNEIVEVYHCHPAPPVGACFKLAKKVSTRPRESGGGVDFYERNHSIYSGEFTDAKRFFFIVEPPNPPPDPPDMDAIRAAANPPSGSDDHSIRARRGQPSANYQARERFFESMRLDYERWKEGESYDLEILRKASPDEREEFAEFLMLRGLRDWRDVEALAEFDHPEVADVLRKGLKSNDATIRMAVLRYAPHLISARARGEAIVGAIEMARPFEGLSETLEQVAAHHPPQVMTALFKAVLNADGRVAVHYAAMLFYLHGKAKLPFDWDHRPFFLKFNTTDGRERLALFKELCEKLGVNPDEALGKK